MTEKLLTFEECFKLEREREAKEKQQTEETKPDEKQVIKKPKK